MGKLSIGVKKGENTPFFKFEDYRGNISNIDNIGNEESLTIEIRNCEVKGSTLANIMDPLKELLEQGIYLRDIYVDIYADARPGEQSFLVYCLYAIISVIPFIPVNSLAIRADLRGRARRSLDNFIILQLLKDKVLDPNSSLQYLELSCLIFKEDASLDIIGKMLSHPNCRLEGFSFQESVIPNIGRWVKDYLGNTRLKLLDLAYVGEDFDDAAAMELGKILKNHPTLKFLGARDLYNITDEGGKAIAEALKTNTVLEYLNFANTDIGEATLIGFAEALKYSKLVVLILDLGDEDTDSEAPLDESAIAFGEAFKVNNTLVYFSLRRQRPTEAGVEALRQGILQNQSLQYFATGWDTDGEFNCILDKNKHTRKKHNLLWTIWEEYGDLPSTEQSIQDVAVQSADEKPVQIQRPSVFAGCEFFRGTRLPFFTTAEGYECDLYWQTETIDIASALGFFENATPELDVELPAAASASTLEYSSYFQWLPREMAEDALSLPWPEDEIKKEKERQTQREVRESFWQELLEPAAKRRKIESEEGTRTHGENSTAGLFN